MFLLQFFPFVSEIQDGLLGGKATCNWLAVYIIDAQLMEIFLPAVRNFMDYSYTLVGEIGQSTCYLKKETKHIYIEHFSINNIRTPWCVLKLCKQADIIKSDIKSHLNHTN